jgi:Flp pilus assembly protein TadG
MKISFRDNRGAALVELALTTPLFFLLMMGSLEIGRVAYYSVEVENAARAGASFGAVNVQNANTSASVQQAAKNDAPDVSNLIVVSPGQLCVCETITTATNSPSFNPTSGTTSCTSTTITNCTAESSSSLQSVVSYITVSTQATVDPLVHVPGLPNTYNLTGYSALRILTN